MNPKTRTKNKSNGSSRFLLCCMPQELDINMKDAVSVKQGVVLPRVLPAAAVAAAAAAASLCGDDDEKNFNLKEKTDLQIMKKKKKKKKNKGNHQRLLGILKAIFFESSVARKIRKRKNKQKKRQTNGNENSMHKELSEVDDDNNNNNGTINVSNTSASCSSSFSSKSSSDKNKSIERKQKGSVVQSQRQHGKGCYGPNVGLCFILISLLILIIWGKLCAIFCTSTWLLFGACRRINSSSSAVDYRRHDSEEYKKKIIMEGLLEREHSRRL